MKRIPRKLLFITVLLLIAIPLTVFLIKTFTVKPPTKEQLAEQAYNDAQEQAEVLSATVAKQTAIPKNETPNVATITDVTLLQDQEFFKEAQNGDKILIYEKQKLIVLYRPTENRVIATAPVLFNQEAEQETSSDAESSASNAATSFPGVSL